VYRISDEKLDELLAYAKRQYDYYDNSPRSYMPNSPYNADVRRYDALVSALKELKDFRTRQGKFDPQAFWDAIPDESSPAWPVVAVDLNGVLDQYRGWSGKVEMFPPAEGVKGFLRDLRDDFNTIIVFTATMPISVAEEWLAEHGLDEYVDYVTNWKPPAAVYIDDKAVTHRGSFEDTLRAVADFVPHWERTNE
jgi:hypothetical protein